MVGRAERVCEVGREGGDRILRSNRTTRFFGDVVREEGIGKCQQKKL